MKGRTIRVAITIGAGLATLFISSSVASAHTQLLSTTPQAGQILRESPARVSATFDQILLPTGDAMVVTDAEHNFVDIGTAQLDGPTISIAVKPKLPDGIYQAAYRVISADGHPVESAFSFTVGVPKLTGTLNPQNQTVVPEAISQTEWLRFLWIALALGIALVATIGVIRRRKTRGVSSHDETPKN